MFDENYKNAMDNINLDNETKDKILDKIILKEELKSSKNPAVLWRVAFACVACVAIILGVVFVPRNSFKSVINNKNTPQTLMVSKSYKEIYDLLKPKKTYRPWIKYNKVNVSDSIIYEEEIEYVDGAAAPNTMNNGNTSTNTTDDKAGDFSNTTEQVEGVAEADIVKTDGEYIYYLFENELSIFNADGENTTLVSKTTIEGKKRGEYNEMLLKDDRLILLQRNCYLDKGNYVAVIIYDISNPVNPRKVTQSCQEGRYNSSRMVGDYIYLISNCSIDISNIDKNDPATFVPTTETNGVCEVVPADSIYRYDEEKYTSQYTVIGAFNYKDGQLSDTASLLGGTDNIYCSQGNIILANSESNRAKDMSDESPYSSNKTVVSRLTIEKGQIEYKATGEVDGTLENQFYIDEHNGYFRFVTTVTTIKPIKKEFENDDGVVEDIYIIEEFDNTSAHLTILDSELKKVGEIGDLAKGERVYSVRFMGDVAYFVTFRQTDPLFSADLSDPKNPKILGELKIPGFSEYMYPYGDGLLLGFGNDADEQTGRSKDLKLSMFNITDPANVTEQAITKIDGCTYSPALNNHKSMLVHANKNLIGFAATANYQNMKYMIYEYKDGGFNCLATLNIDGSYQNAMDDIRGLFIGDEFYIIFNGGLYVFDIDSFSLLSNIVF